MGSALRLLLLTAGRGSPRESNLVQRPKLLLLCSWVTCYQPLFPFLSLKASMESESHACECTRRKKNGLLARFAFVLQKRAWEKRLKCPENFSLGLFLPLPLASGITLQRLLIPSQPQQGRSERCRSQASKRSSGLEAACVKKEKASAVDVCCAKDFKRWCVKCWKC